MVKDMILVNREALLTELYSVFDIHTAETLLHVLDNVADQVHTAGVSREDFSELKQIVARIAKKIEQLVETQRQTEELINRRFEQHDRRLTNIEEVMQHHDQRLTNIEGDVSTLKSDVEILKEDVNILKEDVKVLKEDVKVLKEDVKVLKEDVNILKEDVNVLKNDVGKLKGYALETRYRDRVASYFGRLLRRSKVVDFNRLMDDLEARLSSEEFEQLLSLDLLVVGKPKQQPEIEELYLAVEVSSVIDKNDVQRARERAELLRKAGFKAIPVAAGEEITEGAEPEARQQHVVIVQDGRTLLWQEALNQWS